MDDGLLPEQLLTITIDTCDPNGYFSDMLRRKTSTVLLGLVSAFALSCDSDDFEPSDGPELLAIANTPEGVDLEFRRSETGTIVVSEYGPADAPSPIVYLMTNEDMTPLELFLAVAPNQEPPRALVDAHEQDMRQRGRPLQPRNLYLPDPSFRSTSIYDDYYSTNCNTPSDQSWFDGSWSSLGMEWHIYYPIVNADGSQDPYPRHYSALSPTTNSYITHTCLYDILDQQGNQCPSCFVQHFLLDSGGSLVFQQPQYVYEGHRSVIWVWGTPYDRYQGLTSTVGWTISTFRAGAMANDV